MPKLNDDTWYAEKRAMAYVYSLFAMHDEAQVIDVAADRQGDYGVDLVVDLSQHQKFKIPRKLAVAVKGYRELPGETELNRRMSRDPLRRVAETMRLPAIVCFVQFVDLAAVYSWIVEPDVENGKPALKIPAACDWAELQKDAVKEILSRVNDFYEAIYDVEVRPKHK
jgi:hypothetical protein